MSERSRSDVDEGGSGPLKVLYVMGAGRSGSTILGVALGNCEGIFFAGELDHWLVQGGRPHGRRDDVDRFWRAVLVEMGEQTALFGGGTTSLERSSVLFDPRRWPRRRRLRIPYRRASERLYRVIADMAPASVVLDTSHYPLRARELRKIDGIDLHLLYLTRDARSVLRSLGRRDVRERTFGAPAANAYLWLTHMLATAVFLTHPRRRRLLVRYEDFAADPARAIGEILRFCEHRAALPDVGSLRTGVPFHGNRLIEADLVSLHAPRGVGGRGYRLSALLQAPWTVAQALLRPALRGR